MENTHNKTFTLSFVAAAMASALMFAPSAMATEPTEPAEQTEHTLEKEASEQQERIEQERNPETKTRSRFKKITLSDDRETYTVNGKEDEGAKDVDGETFYVKYRKDKVRIKDKDKSFRTKVKRLNDRDGFYLAYSAVTSVGDDIHSMPEESHTAFDSHFSYRIQIAGLFVESPGLNSRRLHGLYATNAWGLNFYNSDTWSFDLYKQTNTEKVEGLREVQNRNEHRRGGVRATGYFDNSQLQFIFSPYARGNDGDDGIEASISYTHYWQVKNWNIYGSLGAQYQSQEVVGYGQPEGLNDEDRVNTSAELGFEYALNKDWVLGAFTSYNKYPSQRSTDDTSIDGSRSGLLLTFVF